MKADRQFYYADRLDTIIEILSSKSPSIVSYIRDNKEHTFSLWYKDIKHADLISCGKSTPSRYKTVNKKKVLKKRIDPEYDKNVLNYYTVKEMKVLAQKKPFPTAKQSNIHVSEEFLQYLGIKDFRGNLSSYADFLLVNDTLTYFNQEYTEKVATALGKNLSNCKGKDIVLSNGDFTPVDLSIAAHGIGTSADKLFHDLRHNIFSYDRIMFLIENNLDKKKVFILLDKSPVFYQIAGLRNSAWVKYITRSRQQEDANVKAHEPLTVTESRSLQKIWKDNLAREMMTQTDHETEVFCPFTRITADYDKVGTLFRASHIVSFADSNLEQKYDLYNGLLLCANADALFDKHLISIDENKQLVFSFLIANNKLLKERLLLNQGVYKDILTSERMQYLKKHYQIFQNKEEKRKTIPNYLEDEELAD